MRALVVFVAIVAGLAVWQVSDLLANISLTLP